MKKFEWQKGGEKKNIYAAAGNRTNETKTGNLNQVPSRRGTMANIRPPNPPASLNGERPGKEECELRDSNRQHKKGRRAFLVETQFRFEDVSTGGASGICKYKYLRKNFTHITRWRREMTRRRGGGEANDTEVDLGKGEQYTKEINT